MMTAHLRDMLAKVKDSVEQSGVTVLRTRSSKTNEHPLASTIQAILGILLALGILILFLSSSLIANTLSALLNQHLRAIGVMKLVGGRRNQIFQMYIVLILIFSAIALAIAVPLGGQGAYALAEYIANKVNFQLLGYRIVPLAMLIQVVVGLAIPLLAGLVPVLNGSNITVLRAVSGDIQLDEKKRPADGVQPDTKAGRRRTKINTWLSRHGIHMPRPLLISLRNTFRRRGRLVSDPLYPDHGRRHLYLRLQRAGNFARLHKPDRKILPGGCDPRFHQYLPARRGGKYRHAGTRRGRRGRLGLCQRRGPLSRWDCRRYHHHPGPSR